MAKYALLMGSNYFGTANQLSCCLDDVEDYKKLFSSQGYSCRTITGSDMTAGEMKSTIEELVRGLKSGDSFAICYSGHGVQINTKNEHEEDGLTEALVCEDFNWSEPTMILDDYWSPLLQKVPASVRGLLIFDCCHSSNSTRDIVRSRSIPNPFIKAVHKRAQRGFTRSSYAAEIIFLAACQENQTSADVPALKNGAFSFFLLQTLEEFEYKISYRVLMEITSKKLKANGYSQTPALECRFELKDLNVFQLPNGN